MTIIAGVDDAGRGSVIGPLIISGVNFKDNQIVELKKLGVKDSKVLTPKKRLRLNDEIKRIAIQWNFAELSPSEIDKIVFKGQKFHRLNWLEAVKMAEVIKKLSPDIAYVDASDVNARRFGQQIDKTLPLNVKIVSEHHADIKYVIVSAASILAKVRRDEIISSLWEKYGNFGSGYPSDPKTKKFLLNQVEKGEIPQVVRKSWKTVQRLI